jgi:hypothetical protein
MCRRCSGIGVRPLQYAHRVAAAPADFAKGERARAVAWKQTSLSLPEEARLPAQYVGKEGATEGPLYHFCVPVDYAHYTLLPEVRDMALGLFAELGIPWHPGVGDGPSNHLLSSQVQCVNALGQMVFDPARVVRAFGPVLGTAEVEQIEPGRWLTFEYIGPDDVLHEAVDGVRTRGARCTSVDAAFLHRTADGVRELVLVEWKYTESYTQTPADPRRDRVRLERYGDLLSAADGPVDGSLLPFEELLQEPLYQLMRQQLLAYELEKREVLGAQRVVVAHVQSPGNIAYQRSLFGPVARTLGSTVDEVWRRLLRHRDRFTTIDSAVFADPTVTSDEYVSRYGAT